MSSALTPQRRFGTSNRTLARPPRSHSDDDRDESSNGGQALRNRFDHHDETLSDALKRGPSFPPPAECSRRIVTAVKQCWAASGYVELKSLDCHCTDGVLFIRGSVTSFYYKQLAQETVRRVEGIGRIVNELTVRGDESRGTQNP